MEGPVSESSPVANALRFFGAIAVFGLLVSSGPRAGERLLGGAFGRYIGNAFGWMLGVSALDLIQHPYRPPNRRGSLGSQVITGLIIGPLIGLTDNENNWSLKDHLGWVLAAAVAGAIAMILLEPLQRRLDRIWDAAYVAERANREAHRGGG